LGWSYFGRLATNNRQITAKKINNEETIMYSRTALSFVAAMAIVLATGSAYANPTLGQIDTFQDGTKGTWQGGGELTHSNASVVVTNGGPTGTGDHYLKINSSVDPNFPNDAPRLLAISSTPATEWGGDFVTPGVTGVSMDLLNPNSFALTMRVAFRDGTANNSPAYVTNNAAAITLPADNAWHHVTFNFTTTDMTTVGSPGTFTPFLQAVQEFRIVDSATATFMGDQFISGEGFFGVDNIQAVPEPCGLFLCVVALGAMVAVGRRTARVIS
jgi:hypothetical protein